MIISGEGGELSIWIAVQLVNKPLIANAIHAFFFLSRWSKRYTGQSET